MDVRTIELSVAECSDLKVFILLDIENKTKTLDWLSERFEDESARKLYESYEKKIAKLNVLLNKLD
ncbi:hypothetical protein ACYSNR_14995 [Enterococcus sp. LJL128]